MHTPLRRDPPWPRPDNPSAIAPRNAGYRLIPPASSQIASAARRALTPASWLPCLIESPSHLSSAEEGQAFEQMHVLLVLQQRAVQRREPLSRVAPPQPFRRPVLL